MINNGAAHSQSDLGSQKIEAIREALSRLRTFRFCGPSDDLEVVTDVTLGYRHLLVQVKRLAAPILPSDAASRSLALEGRQHLPSLLIVDLSILAWTQAASGCQRCCHPL